MKLGAISPVFNDEPFMRGCINSFKPYVDQHIILSARQSWNGGVRATDRTREVSEDMGAWVVESIWQSEEKQRNAGLALLKDKDWVLVNDADMWFTKAFMEDLMVFLAQTDATAVIAPQYSYWFNTDYRLVDDDYMPVIAVKPGVKFIDKSCVDAYCAVFPWHVHHLAWCAPKDIIKKITTYGHAPEFKDPYGWYHKHYRGWEPGMDAHMPDKHTEPGHDFKVEYAPLPEELKRWL